MAATDARALSIYRYRRPETTALYRCVQENLDTFLTQLSPATLPAFIQRELESFLACGILAHGFARVRCSGCGFDRLDAFACKGRGVCPSCCGRRMADTSAYLVEQIFPDGVPVRQWVLSLPKPLRARLAHDAGLLAGVVAIFVAAVRQHLTRLAKRELHLARASDAHVGVVTAIQRFGSAAELNVHLHSLVCDGVFVADGSGVRFCELRAPTTDEITAVAEQVCKRVLRLLTKRGLWVDGVLQTAANDEPPDVLDHISAASVQGTLVFASGARPMRLVAAASGTAPIALKGYAFDVDASVRVHGNDRPRLERLCRYLLRPPIANDRIVQRADGRFVLRLKRPWSDGTTHLVFDGPELIARLVALIPPPRVHQVRYHGVFAPRAKLRCRIVRLPLAASAPADSPDVNAPCRPCGRQRMSWSKRV